MSTCESVARAVIAIGLGVALAASRVSAQVAGEREALDANERASDSDRESDSDLASDDGAPLFRARARAPEVPPAARRFEPAQVRDVAGAFGDPLRTIESMPGVVPILSGLPYVFVRGSPPAGTLYVYDDIPLPQLFHLALGPAVVHPRMLGAIQLHSGVAPSQWGRHIGGVIAAEGPADARPDDAHGEAEVRLLDINGWMEAPLGDGAVSASLRIGWPGIIASAVVPSLELVYGDYQLRATLPLGRGERVQLVALGSYDRFSFVTGTSSGPARTAIEMQFHRVEARFERRVGGLRLLAALRFGYDRSPLGSRGSAPPRGAGDGGGVERAQLAPRVMIVAREGPVIARAGADAVGSVGPVDLGAGITVPPTRSVAGAFAELDLRIDEALTLTAGARLDVWLTGARVEGAIDPRLRIAWRPIEGLTLFAGAGVTRQPPTFYLPLPGLVEPLVLEGLQTAMQSDVGVSFDHEWLHAELQLFVHRYENLVFSDFFALLATEPVCDPIVGTCAQPTFSPRTNGLSWGGELLVAIAPGQPVSGWLSYTLAWASTDPIAGVAFRPSYDVRHVANLVLRWELGAGFSLGARIHVRSGGPRGVFYADFREPAAPLRRHEQELPGFYRADAQAAYAWDAGWCRFRFVLEWLNVTIADEATGIDCERDGNGLVRACRAISAPPIFAPNIGLRMEL